MVVRMSTSMSKVTVFKLYTKQWHTKRIVKLFSMQSIHKKYITNITKAKKTTTTLVSLWLYHGYG